MLQRYHFIHNLDRNEVRVEKHKEGPYVKWDDLLPVLRAIKQDLRSYRLHSNPLIRSRLIDAAMDKLEDITGDATKGVEG